MAQFAVGQRGMAAGTSAGGPAGGPALGGAERAFRLALARAAREAMGLALDVTRSAQDRMALAELVDLPPDRAQMVRLDQCGGEGGDMLAAAAGDLQPQALRRQPLQQLRDSELQRAAQLWQRKFGAVAQDARERARQMRFLAGRGFSADVIRRVVRGADED